MMYSRINNSVSCDDFCGEKMNLILDEFAEYALNLCCWWGYIGEGDRNSFVDFVARFTVIIIENLKWGEQRNGKNDYWYIWCYF